VLEYNAFPRASREFGRIFQSLDRWNCPGDSARVKSFAIGIESALVGGH
jgi:hypothetical protein